MAIAKVLRLQGENVAQVAELTSLLQDVLDTVNPTDLQKLLRRFKKDPSIVKTLLKYI